MTFSVKRTKIDRDGLPEALLDPAKVHMRVEFTRDDDYITGCVRRAIDFFERASGLVVFEGAYDWVPGPGIAVDDGTVVYAVPFIPAPSKVIVYDDTNVDVSASYRIGGTVDEFGKSVLIGPSGPISSIKATVGYNEDTLPPGILSFVLEAAAWFYENREIARMTGVDAVPYLNQLMTAYWVPRV